ncbi:MAG: mercury(II) reductase [Dehalococcoidia bacterium]|nr:mercury(II) reductase [Dehalococcoidia bacterium]
MREYDYIIIGGGAGAFAAATRANDVGVRSVLINDGLPLGGTCVNVGCVPSKHLLAVGDEYYYPQRPVFDALKNGHKAAFDFGAAIREKRLLIDQIRASNYSDVLASFNGLVELIVGRAQFVSPQEVEVNGERVRGSKFLIATGSRPSVLPFPGIEGVDYLTNRTAMELETLPASMIVIGAGPIGLELGQMFLHFGTKVTVLEKIPQILPRVEPEVAAELQRSLEAEGMQIHCACEIKRVWQQGTRRFVEADVLGELRTFEADQLLLATGVVPNSDGMGLEAAGMRVNARGFIETDPFLETSTPGIYAAGDVVGKAFLETVAAKEGATAAANALGAAGKTINYEHVPAAVFTNPQVAMVGLTEEQEVERFGACSCRTVEVARIPKAQAVKETRGLIKMVIHPETSVILGVHIVAPMAADLIHEATLAVKFGLTVDDIIDTVHVFPTLSEGIKLAAQAFTRDISVMSCCIV